VYVTPTGVEIAGPLFLRLVQSATVNILFVFGSVELARKKGLRNYVVSVGSLSHLVSA